MNLDQITIPFNRSTLVGRELDYVAEAMRIGQIAGDQTFTKKCQALLQSIVGVPRAYLTTSCTHALEMSALLLNIGPDDEVIVPSFTFVSTANAYALRGARLVFADIRPDTLNLDESRLESLITPRTKAIVVVHYAGVACEMDAILAIARRHDIPVVEDNAHGLFGEYKGRPLGTFGCLATQSFHETKNISCGEGGAILVNDPAMIERTEIIREKGTNRSRFFRGEIDKYTWVDIGSSYVMSDVLAAFLYGQLAAADVVQARRREVWNLYQDGLAAWAVNYGVGTPTIPTHCQQSYHMFYLLLPSLEIRTELIASLKRRGILAVFHYIPLHQSEMGQKFGGKPGDCPVSESVSDRLLRLPFYAGLSETDQQRVIESVRAFTVNTAHRSAAARRAA
jgi:dTDP-4-amino-4,6-dideoxygalactose transaminase